MRLRGDISAQLGKFRLNTGAFDWDLQGVAAVFGRSGAGKSSLLQALAGVLPHAQGWLQTDDSAVWQIPGQAPPPHQRGIGLVFQQPGLFPHLDVFGNLKFAAKRSGASAIELTEIAQRCRVDTLLARRVEELSGGEIQRVAIARALLARPRLLCLDEPLSALDWPARKALMDLIEELATDHQLPVLYVSHDAAEVERLASQVIHMQAGRVTGQEPLQQALQRLDSPLFADHHVASVLFGQLQAADQWGLSEFQSRHGATFRLLLNQTIKTPRARLRIQARDVSLARKRVEGISVLNQLPAQVLEIAEPIDGRVLVRLALNPEDSLLAEVTAWSAHHLDLSVGDEIYALVKSVALID